MSGVVDHIRAINRGGTEDASNLGSAHNKCNRDKSDKDFAQNIIKRSSTLARPATTRRAARSPILDDFDDDEDDDDDEDGFDPASVSF